MLKIITSRVNLLVKAKEAKEEKRIDLDDMVEEDVETDCR